jgi:hypothetical protein
MKAILAIVLLAASSLVAQSTDSVVGHATHEQVNGKVILKVFIQNSSEEEVELFVGTYGATRDGQFSTIDTTTSDRPLTVVKTGGGTPAAPRFVFDNLEFTAPTPRSSGRTFRNNAQTKIRLRPGDTVEYYRFVVPAEWLSGGFIEGDITFFSRERSQTITVPIKHFSEARADKKTEAEQAGARQPATRSESDSEGGDKPQPEAERRSR